MKTIKMDYPRTCSHCGSGMREGYCIDNGLEYYCSDKCLYEHYTEEEYLEMYDEGNGDSYWTEWEDEASRIVISTYDDMMIVFHDNVYYHETESGSKPLELVAVVNAPYHSEDDHLSGTFNFGESNFDIYFDVSAEGDEDGLYYYFIYKEGGRK
jgi:hypothetical protein